MPNSGFLDSGSVEIPGLWEVQSPVNMDKVVEVHEHFKFIKN